MEIKLKGNYIITSDIRQYILSSWKIVKNKKGEDELRLSNSTYHSTLEHLFQTYKEKNIRLSDCESLESVLKLTKELDEYIHSVLGDI